jgi:hypothetical protein
MRVQLDRDVPALPLRQRSSGVAVEDEDLEVLGTAGVCGEVADALTRQPLEDTAPLRLGDSENPRQLGHGSAVALAEDVESFASEIVHRRIFGIRGPSL